MSSTRQMLAAPARIATTELASVIDRDRPLTVEFNQYVSLGFVNSPAHMKLVDDSKPLAAVGADDCDAALLVGGQGPMYHLLRRRSRLRARRVLLRGGEGDGRDLPRHMPVAQGAARGRPPARRGQDVDRLRQLRGALRGRLHRAEDPAVLDRGRGGRAPDRERRLPDVPVRRRQPPCRDAQRHRHRRAADQGLVASQRPGRRDRRASLTRRRDRGVRRAVAEDQRRLADVGFALSAWFVDPQGNSIGLLQFKGL